MNTTVTVSQRILTQIAAAIVATTAAAWHTGVRAEPAERISAQEGVTLKVTPKPWLSGAREWSFSVTLDTHSQALEDKLSEGTVLVVDGREVAPVQWTGAAPAGHHREGVLTFPAPDAQPAAVELRLQRPGEATPRVLRWDATSLK
ncbi:hypothetical protein [Cupriavidus pinatubonensis]|uniref:Transmembrane protein n=1 Tax=Cupriavidus pinatubonensis TaxID=248026 RepID=A0ABM8XUE9_9BURK|nr:hypothetical protein [Cupriavidus pinatubonensis]CAG9183981.1 hypothetical protein LMG23994_05279 [Cupriavidus pinatubonensis]